MAPPAASLTLPVGANQNLEPLRRHPAVRVAEDENGAACEAGADVPGRARKQTPRAALIAHLVEARLNDVLGQFCPGDESTTIVSNGPSVWEPKRFQAGGDRLVGPRAGRRRHSMEAISSHRELPRPELVAARASAEQEAERFAPGGVGVDGGADGEPGEVAPPERRTMAEGSRQTCEEESRREEIPPAHARRLARPQPPSDARRAPSTRLLVPFAAHASARFRQLSCATRMASGASQISQPCFSKALWIRN